MDDPKKTGPDRTAEELVGRVISGRYRIDSLLAMGGMGAVYLGWHRHLRKRVAVKVLRPETENLPELVTRFQREAIAGAHVVHANVAAATDFGQLQDGSYFLVLEYLAGRTLHEVIEEDAPVPAPRVIHIVRQLAEGLAALHARGILHRDLKPKNVMITADSDGSREVVKLIDLGFAKVPVDEVVHASDGGAAGSTRMRLESLREDAPQLTAVGTIVGTISYLAPESVNGMEAVDARSDLYALGLLAYQLLAGKHPFEAEDDAAMFARHRFTPPPPIQLRAPGVVVPPALEALVLRLLEKDPSARFASAEAVVDELDAITARDRIPPPRAATRVGVAAAIALGVGGALALVHVARGPSRAVLAAASSAPSGSASVAVSARSSESPPYAMSAVAAGRISPSAAVVASAAPIGSIDAGSILDARAALARGLRVHDLRAAEAAFMEIAEREPEAFREPELALGSRELAVALDLEGKADRLFERMTSSLGPVGLDLLYDLVATRGKASAAVRAASALRKPGILDRASPALRIAFELREAPCVEKAALLDRAVQVGDARALVVLETQGEACFRKNDRPFQEAMAALRTRLWRGP